MSVLSHVRTPMPTTVTSSASSKICCHVIVTKQRSILEQFAPEFRYLPLQSKKGLSELQAHHRML